MSEGRELQGGLAGEVAVEFRIDWFAELECGNDHLRLAAILAGVHRRVHIVQCDRAADEVIGFLLFFGFATDENRRKMAILPCRSTFRSVQQPPEFVRFYCFESLSSAMILPIRCGISVTRALPMQKARCPSVIPSLVQPFGKR